MTIKFLCFYFTKKNFQEYFLKIFERKKKKKTKKFGFQNLRGLKNLLKIIGFYLFEKKLNEAKWLK